MAWKVVLCCSNRSSIRSLALILLSQTRWIVMPCLRTSISLQPFVQTRLDGGSLFVHKHGCTDLVQTRLDIGSLFVYKHQSPALCFKHVWMWFPVCVRINLQPCVSNTFELRFLVCVRASVNSPFFQTRLIMVACLFTSISLEPKWLRHGSDGDPTPRGVGFRLSPDLVPSSALHQCPERDVQLAESLQHADILVPFSTLRRSPHHVPLHLNEGDT